MMNLTILPAKIPYFLVPQFITIQYETEFHTAVLYLSISQSLLLTNIIIIIIIINVVMNIFYS
jgi:hypothetical protein